MAPKILAIWRWIRLGRRIDNTSAIARTSGGCWQILSWFGSLALPTSGSTNAYFGSSPAHQMDYCHYNSHDLARTGKANQRAKPVKKGLKEPQ
jgi:hypothetical protein